MLIDNAVFRVQSFYSFHVCGVNLEIISGAQTPLYFTPSSLFTLICPTFTLKPQVSLYVTMNDIYFWQFQSKPKYVLSVALNSVEMQAVIGLVH